MHCVPRAVAPRGRLHRVRQQRRLWDVRRQDCRGRQRPHARRWSARPLDVRDRVRADARLAQHAWCSGALAILRQVSTWLGDHMSQVYESSSDIGLGIRYLPEYGYLTRAHDAALVNGTPSGMPEP